ncbi:hypothetical protein N7508_001815 [Penicillium antarcticum]|uniref:uncharacterized protein n=1 Tax=Penicillium antarcticum TaxID=416450 RepID=UPI002389E228|nr:uncharacterized protein N7508_001815 [Penicillium antarcticum]KAJ5317307.1 hypothetical protein N7508_001815 [Penicillium antarcticum]
MDSSTPTSDFIDRLISEIAQYEASVETDSGTQIAKQTQAFSGLSPAQLATLKPLMLTLHCLFPNDMLPALDILDRKLVRRVMRADRHTPANQGERVSPHGPKAEANEDMFIVISASVPSHLDASPPSFTRDQDKGYEVRLRAWNCSCPTFTISAYRDTHQTLAAAEDQPDAEILPKEPIVYPFGGTMARGTARLSPPVCKHILACILSVRCPRLFGVDQDGGCAISKEELAGWCAGWGG